jgi:hypothetical protein
MTRAETFDRFCDAAVADAWLDGKPAPDPLPPFDPATWRADLGRVLHARRVQLGMTPLDLAARAGTTEHFVRRMSERPPNTDRLTRRLALAMGMGVPDLIARQHASRVPRELASRVVRLLQGLPDQRGAAEQSAAGPKGRARRRLAEFVASLR